MTKHRTLLLAGTILPALLLAPLYGASAQSPDPSDRPGRQHREGGAAREGGPAQRQGGERAQGERGQGGGERAQGERGGAGGGGERRRAREDAQGAPAGGGETKRARQNADTERPARGAATTADEPKASRKAVEAPKAAETPRAAETPKAAQGGDKAETRAEKRRERRENRENARDTNDSSPKGAARDNARDNNARDNNTRDNADRDNGTRRGQNADRDTDRARGNRDRADDNDRGDRNDRNRRAGDRDDRRDNRAGDRDDRRDNDRRDNDRDRRFGNDDRRDDRRGGPNVTIGIGGGFLPPTQARRMDQLRNERREVREGDRVFIREPGRTIVQQGGRAFIVHDETDRYRALGLNVRRERRGGEFVEITTRPNGEEILTYNDPSGRMLRRVRRGRDGREVVIINNGVGGRVGAYDDDIVALPPPPLRIPRDRYVVDYRDANAGTLYETLSAPPLAAPPRRYTLDQVRYSPDVRNYVRSVDINTINFDSGSWDVPAEATRKLEALADAINKAVDRNPNSVFLIEGYTDATGNPNDNLSLSDRRAQSVAEIMTKDFKVPPENLTTQGYGQQNPKEDTSGPSAANRRVVVRNITQLLASGSDEPANGQ